MSLTEDRGAVETYPPHVQSSSRPRLDINYVLKQMRIASRLAPEELAQRLGTTTSLIWALENREYARLPFWPEVARVLHAFGDLLGLDITPLIQQYQHELDVARQYQQHGLAPWHPVGSANAHAPVTTAAPTASIVPQQAHATQHFHDGQAADLTRTRSRRRTRTRRIVRVAAGFAVTATVAMGLWLLAPIAAETVGGDAQAELPKVVEDNTGIFTAFKLPKVEETGVRWLPLGDPAHRKSRRLPSRDK